MCVCVCVRRLEEVGKGMSQLVFAVELGAVFFDRHGLGYAAEEGGGLLVEYGEGE